MIDNKLIKSIGLGLLTLSILVGCNDAKENESTDTNAKKEIKIYKVASAENFKKVLNQYIGDGCIYIHTDEFPVEIDMKDNFFNTAGKYKTLEKLEFIKANGKTEEKISRTRTKIKTKYILTEKGKKHYKTGRGFCVARQKVDEITNFTAPKDLGGQTISKVKFTLKTKEEPFVKDINKSIFGGSVMRRNIFKYAKSNSTNLILTEMKGWIPLSVFRKK